MASSEKPIFTSIFLEETRKLLKEKPKHITYALISEETGLTQDWLESILYREIDPGVRKIETLYNYLSNKPFVICSDLIASAKTSSDEE